MSSYNLSKWNPPPPPNTTSASLKVSSAEITKIYSATPSNPFSQGIPVQPIDSPTETVYIDFNINPFTYINLSNIGTTATPKLTVSVKNVPVGTFFMANGPVSWAGEKGVLILEDLDENGDPLVNAELIIEPRGTLLAPSVHTNYMIGRDHQGWVARVLN